MIISEYGQFSHWQTFLNFDFQWIEKSSEPEHELSESENPILINLDSNSDQMTHSHPIVDRCCKLPSPGFTFDGLDEVKYEIQEFRKQKRE